jgi:hypothetical protein
MTKNGMKVLDSDMHLMEPVDLWERYIDAPYKADAPRGLTSDNVRDLRLAHPDGRYWGLPASHNRNSEQHRGHNFDKNQGIYRSHAERGSERRSSARSNGHRRHRRRGIVSNTRASSFE